MWRRLKEAIVNQQTLKVEIYRAVRSYVITIGLLSWGNMVKNNLTYMLVAKDGRAKVIALKITGS